MEIYKKVVYSYLFFVASILLMYGSQNHLCQEWEIYITDCKTVENIGRIGGIIIFGTSIVSFISTFRIPTDVKR